MVKVRLDQLLLDRGLASSRESAKGLIMTGKVLVDDRPVTKAGVRVPVGAEVRLKEREHPYVSRGGVKLAGALADLELDVTGLRVVDAGASTGGFTDCLLRHGADHVVALDVGRGQLAWSLIQDERVTVMDRVNVRYLPEDSLPWKADLITVDVSFISVLKVVPALLPHLKGGGRLLVLVKPQFEAGRKAVGKGGVVRDEETRLAVVEEVGQGLVELGLVPLGRAESRLKGPKGNQEVFLLFGKA